MKTLAPKFASSKQLAVHISFNNFEFSHTVIAKQKPTAFIKAKLKNNSKSTLIKEMLGSRLMAAL